MARNIRVAYIILAHKNPCQLVRLIKTLACDTADIYLHIDKQVDITPFKAAVRPISLSTNITWLDRVKIPWGSYGMVQASINGFLSVMNSPDPADYIVLTSGQDYPIKSTQQINQFFDENYQKNFMLYFKLPEKRFIFGGMDRIQKYHFNFRGRWFHFPPYTPNLEDTFLKPFSRITRPFPSGFIPYGGMASWGLHRNAVRYILEFIKQRPDFVRFFKLSMNPDELMLHTILMNSSFADSMENNDLRFVIWDKDSPAHPRTLTQSDFPAMSKSGALYARKFDENIDPQVLNLIDDELLRIKMPFQDLIL